MKRKRLFHLFLFLLSLDTNASSLDKKLVTLRAKIRALSHLCEGYIPTKRRPTDPGFCEPYRGGNGVGDSMLFAGILCASGEFWACRSVLMSQASDGGLWRSPQRARHKSDSTWGSHQHVNFSMDQLLGALLAVLYLKKSGHEEFAISFLDRWKTWLENNKSNGLFIKEFSICRWEYTDFKSMDFCALEGSLPPFRGRAALVAKVFRFVGIAPPSRRGLLFGKEHRLGEGDDLKSYRTAMEAGCLVSDQPGFHCHLAAILNLISSYMNIEVKKVLGEGFADNPFIQYIYKTKEIEEIKRSTLRICQEAFIHIKNKKSLRYQWSWERNSLEKAWQHSYGWDCVAMINFLVNDEVNRYPYEDPAFTGDVRNLF